MGVGLISQVVHCGSYKQGPTVHSEGPVMKGHLSFGALLRCPLKTCFTVYMYMSQSCTVIIFPRNVSFRQYYVFVSNAAAEWSTAAAAQFCQRDNF